MERIGVHIQLPVTFLKNYMLIYRAYAQFLIAKESYQGPTDKSLKFLVKNVKESREGVLIFDRHVQVSIGDAWTDIMLCANDYIWPNGELIRDYLIVLVNAVAMWGDAAANKNRQLTEHFVALAAILKVCEVPQLTTFTQFKKWMLDESNPLMLGLPRYKNFEDLNLPIDTARKVFHQLDIEVVKHCSQMRISSDKKDPRALAEEIAKLHDEGLGTFGYCFMHGERELQKVPPGDLFKHRYALIRVRRSDFDNKPLSRSLIRLAQLFILTGMYETWNKTTGIETIAALKKASHRNSTVALQDPNIVNEALDSLRINPKDPVPACVVDGVVFYGVARLQLETQEELKGEPIKSGSEGTDKPRLDPTALLLEKMKASRLTAADQANDNGLIMPIMLLGMAIFLLMK